jgi:hypothetical protein
MARFMPTLTAQWQYKPQNTPSKFLSKMLLRKSLPCDVEHVHWQCVRYGTVKIWNGGTNEVKGSRAAHLKEGLWLFSAAN